MKVYYDLHLHSCLSPCGDDDMTPYNLVNMAKICGLDVIALTDHNSCLNCATAMKIGNQIGIEVIAGMELCTSEEIHVVCLFESLDKALEFSEYVKQNSPKIMNREKIFGNQFIMNEQDEVLAKQEQLLTIASEISIEQVPNLMKEFGAVAYPAHIDRASYSIISSLGDFPSYLDFNAYEVADISKNEELRNKYSSIKSKKMISSSDAHYLENMRDKQLYFELKNSKTKTIIDFLRE